MFMPYTRSRKTVNKRLRLAEFSSFYKFRGVGCQRRLVGSLIGRIRREEL